MATYSGKPEDRFIGVSIAEFLKTTDAHANTGRFSDGTEIQPQVRNALQTFSTSLRAQQASLSSYVFVFSRHVFIVIEF